MSRRCSCSRLIAAVQSDPRLRTLPLAARMLFILLGEAMAAAGTPGELPFAETSRVSLLVSARETDVETHLETLVAEGLVERVGDRLLCPMLVAPPPRARTAQENGRLGGRPRRGETAEQARARRGQGHLVLPIAGGAETQETQQPKPPSMMIDDSISSSSSGMDAPRANPDRVAEALVLAAEVAVLAGMDPARSAWSAREVQGWLNYGAGPDLCREVVADVMTRAKGQPGSLAYFTRAVRAAVDRLAGGAAPAAAAPAEASAVGRWNRAYLAHLDRGGAPGRFPKLKEWLGQAAA